MQIFQLSDTFSKLYLYNITLKSNMYNSDAIGKYNFIHYQMQTLVTHQNTLIVVRGGVLWDFQVNFDSDCVRGLIW